MQITSTWSYLDNPFDNVTKKSYKRMMALATDHRDKLKNNIVDPEINMLYQQFEPAFTAFQKAYDGTHRNAGAYMAATQRVEALFAELTSLRIRKWDIAIQQHHLEGTPEYTDLMPEFRQPFQRGSYDSRQAAMRVLADALTGYPMLITVAQDVTQFAANVEAARTAQQGRENNEQTLGRELENARIALANVMQGIWGYLIYKHQGEVGQVEGYYELQYLRAPKSNNSVSLKAYKISAGARISVFEGQLTNTAYLTLRNTGTQPVAYFTTSNPANDAPAEVSILTAGATAEFYASEETDGSGFNWLVLLNTTLADAVTEIGKTD